LFNYIEVGGIYMPKSRRELERELEFVKTKLVMLTAIAHKHQVSLNALVYTAGFNGGFTYIPSHANNLKSEVIPIVGVSASAFKYAASELKSATLEEIYSNQNITSNPAR
jgi:hypothetical protein